MLDEIKNYKNIILRIFHKCIEYEYEKSASDKDYYLLINRVIEENNYLRKTFLSVNDGDSQNMEENFIQILRAKKSPKRNHTQINIPDKKESNNKLNKQENSQIELFGINKDKIKLNKVDKNHCDSIENSEKSVENKYIKYIQKKESFDSISFRNNKIEINEIQDISGYYQFNLKRYLIDENLSKTDTNKRSKPIDYSKINYFKDLLFNKGKINLERINTDVSKSPKIFNWTNNNNEDLHLYKDDIFSDKIIRENDKTPKSITSINTINKSSSFKEDVKNINTSILNDDKESSPKFFNLEKKFIFCYNNVINKKDTKVKIKDILEREKINLFDKSSPEKNIKNKHKPHFNIDNTKKISKNIDFSKIKKIELLPELILSKETIKEILIESPKANSESSSEELINLSENNKTDELNLQEFCEIENFDANINDKDFDIFSFSIYDKYKPKKNDILFIKDIQSDTMNRPRISICNNDDQEIDIDNSINSRNNLKKFESLTNEKIIKNKNLKTLTSEKILFSTDCTSSVGDNIIKEPRYLDINKDFNKSRNRNASLKNSSKIFLGSNLLFKSSVKNDN